MKEDCTIPFPLRGNQSLILAEIDGKPLVLSGEGIDLSQQIVKLKAGPVCASDLPIRLTIHGLSEEAVDALTSIIEQFHAQTGVPVIAMTRHALLQALLHNDN